MMLLLYLIAVLAYVAVAAALVLIPSAMVRRFYDDDGPRWWRNR